MIDKSMYALLIHADLVIADITTFNPNAIYELGIRHAARPYSTIVMKEKDGNIPFDINHNKTFTYSHMGEDIGAMEAERCVNALTNLIRQVDEAKETDSPLFHNIRGVKPYELPQDEYIQVIKELADKEKNMFALTQRAKMHMKDGNFEEAIKNWKKLVEKSENDPYYIQQLALCTYKNKNESPAIALIDALGIIKKLEPDNRNTVDPETLGITGAIYKRLWENDNKTIDYLDRAIEYYRKGFTVNQDYYTGENYALCLDLKGENVTDKEEQIFYRILAKKVRKEIIHIIEKLKEDEDYEKRSDLMWIYATLSNCYLGLNDIENHEQFKSLFYSKEPDEWQIESFNESIEKLKKLN